MRISLTDRGRLILVALGVAILTMLSIVLVVVYVPQKYTDRVQGKWLRFAFMTALFIGFSLNSFWKLRRSLGFWAILLSFLALHVIDVGHWWAAHNGLPTLIVGLVGGIEWVCMALVIYWVLGVGPDVRPRHSGSRWTPTV